MADNDLELRDPGEEKSPSADEANLLKYVANLTPKDIDKLVDVAKNIYNQSDDKSAAMEKYLSLVSSVFTNSNFNSVGNTPHTRNQRYEIYEEMDESTAYISSALDIISDDATQPDEDGVIIHVSSESDKIVTIVSDFLEEFELEDKISKWARAIAKYGDLFIKVDGEYGGGVSYINDTIYPGLIDRRDLNGKLVAFANNQNTVYSNEDLYAPWDFIHFKLKGDIYKEESSYARLGLTRDTYDTNLTSAYGQSILRPAIKVYTQLRFIENMLLLSRLTNSIRRNIFLINVGDTSPDKAYDSVANYARLLKKDINLNIEDGMYSAAKHTVTYDEDIFIPVGDPQNDIRIEQVGGDHDVKEAYDLEYILNKLFAALKIPKAYLNYEQDLNARSTLIQLDIRYARSVGQLQNTLLSGIRRLVNIHLAYLGFNPDEIDLDITLTTVSAIDEEARTEQLQNKINAARDMWDLLGSIKDTLETSMADPDEEAGEAGSKEVDLESAAEYIMTKYLELDAEVIDKVLKRNKKVSDTESIRSHRIYAGHDYHAPYPSEENEESYMSLRENLMSTKSADDVD